MSDHEHREKSFNYERPAEVINVSRSSDKRANPNWWKHLTPMNILTTAIAIAAWSQFHASQGQLAVMQHQLDEMRSSGQVGTDQTWRAIQNMNWIARSIDENVKTASKQADDTHALAAAAANQAAASTKMAQASQQSASTSRDIFNATNRPYEGFQSYTIQYGQMDANGTLVPTNSLTTTTVAISFIAQFENFGNAPATNCTISWKNTFGGTLISTAKEFPDRPTTIYPTQRSQLRGGLMGKDFLDLISGKKSLSSEVTIEYDGPAGHYVECQKHQFSQREMTFLNLGACPK